jgi:uncharacterized membrane protein
MANNVFTKGLVGSFLTFGVLGVFLDTFFESLVGAVVFALIRVTFSPDLLAIARIPTFYPH